MTWPESRRSIVQMALDALNVQYHPAMDNNETCHLFAEKYFAYIVFSYFGKEIAIHGTPEQKEHILFLMKWVNYTWDENNQVYRPLGEPRDRMEHLTRYDFTWSDEISGIVDEIFKIRSRPMTPLVNNMSRQMLFDIAPTIIHYGTESQLENLETFIYT